MQQRKGLFSIFGVELEYMIVRRDTLAVAPWADRILVDAGGQPVSDIDRGPITWSNELTAHVIELKCTEPVATLDGLADAMAAEVREVNRRLAAHGAHLLPTAMHPGMRPDEAVLWAHEYSEVYETFNRIFDCRGHGWSNVQSVHLNLPFADDAEFGRLHAAIRLVLPLLPALAASSPLVEGRLTGMLDNRLEFYRSNSVKLPPLCGAVIPEPVYSESAYRREIFERIAAALAPHDPGRVLDPEFSNSRGVIARFSRGSVEVRLLDVQECPAADLAVVRTVVALLRELVAEERVALAEQQAAPVETLSGLLRACIHGGATPEIADPLLLRAFGVDKPAAAGALWRAVINRLDPGGGASAAEQRALQIYRDEGPLAARQLAWLKGRSAATWPELYGRLADSLQTNRPFSARE